MKIPLYQVDSFTNQVFKGNPAAVCILDNWLEEEKMQNIAKENNLSETAFVVKADDYYEIKWFTPEKEIDLCGHATLASAHIIFDKFDNSTNKIVFKSQSGILEVFKDNNLLSLIFPNRIGIDAKITEDVVRALGKEPKKLYRSRDYMAIFDNEDDVKNLNPDMEIIKKLDVLGVIVTSKGDKYDFVSRYFAPKLGINEDPVTGSTHCTLIPYWRGELGKDKLKAYQHSDRGGELTCEYLGEKVKIAGEAVIYMEGYINI